MTRARYDVIYFPLGAAAFGGAERSIMELAAAQQAAGRRVLLAYEEALKQTDFLAQAEAMGLPVMQVDWAPEHGLWHNLQAAAFLARRLESPLVHFNISWRQSMWAIPLVWRLLTDARLVGTMRALPEPYDRFPRRRWLGLVPSPRLWILPDLLMGRAWARSLHATVSVNRDDYPPRMVREFGFDSRRLSVILNGVRVPEHVPTAEEKRAAKCRLGLAEQDFVVAYVGRVSPEKGLRYMIDAMPACDLAVQLIVAGEGNEVDSLRQRAADAGVAGRVHFLGYVGQPFDVMSAADVTVVPSLWNEAFGRVVVEAMACGSAVVATAVGGMREIFTDGREGIFVQKGNAAALAAAVNRLAGDPLLLARLQRAGRALAEAHYSTTRVAADYARLYSTLQEA